jgi:hypothetical protein
MKRKTAADKKDALISGLIEARRNILEAASSLPPDQHDEVFLGIWSVRDLIAHLRGWDVTNQAAARDILAGTLPAFYEHYDRDWRTYNASLVKKHKRGDLANLIESARRSHQILASFLRRMPPEELERDRGLRFKGYIVTIARLLQAEIDDERIHHQQIHDFARSSRQGTRA